MTPLRGIHSGVFDRHLSLSTNNRRGGGMMANIARSLGFCGACGLRRRNLLLRGSTTLPSPPEQGLLGNDPGANGASWVQPCERFLTFNSTAHLPIRRRLPHDCGGSFTYLVNGLNTATPRSSAR